MELLNPIDNLFLATHESLQARGYCGLACMLIIELDGPLPAPDLARAISEVSRACPQLFSRIARGGLRSRACRASPAGYMTHEIAYCPQPPATPAERNDLLAQAMNAPMNARRATDVSVLHFIDSPHKHWLGVCWPHYLMDLQGALVLLRQVDLRLRGMALTLRQDSLPGPPFVSTRGQRMRMGLRWLRQYTHFARLRQPRLAAIPEVADCRPHFLSHELTPEHQARFREKCGSQLAPGPRLYMRGMMIALAREYVRMCRERGRPRDRYLFSHVMPAGDGRARAWPIGNEVVVPWVEFGADDLTDVAHADGVLRRQIGSDAQSCVRTEWTGAAWLQAMPFAWLRWLQRSRAPAAAGGLSPIRFDDGLTRLGQAEIANIIPLGTNNAHPGWLLLHSTYQSRANLSLVFYRDFLTVADAREFLARLEAGMCE